MVIHENYNLIFFNKIKDNRVIKTVGGINNPSPIFSPLSEYVYLAGHYEAIDEIIIDLDKILNNETLENSLEIGTETILISSTTITIKNSDGREQNIPASDLKQIFFEYKQFLSIPPLNGTLV